GTGDRAQDLSIAMRYLLHAQAAETDDGRTLFVERPSVEDNAWARLGALALEGANEIWRKLSDSLVDGLSRASLQILNVQILDAEWVSSLVRELGPDVIEGARVPSRDYDYLIRTATATQLQLLKDIAMHPLRDGRLGRIDSKTYSVIRAVDL